MIKGVACFGHKPSMLAKAHLLTLPRAKPAVLHSSPSPRPESRSEYRL